MIVVTGACAGEPTLASTSGDEVARDVTTPTPRARVSGADAVMRHYTQWAARHESGLTMSLGWSEGLSSRSAPRAAKGQISVDGDTGAVAVVVQGHEGALGDVWLVDNRPGLDRSVIPEPGDAALFVGSLRERGDIAELSTVLDPGALDGFEIDLAVVTRPGVHPEDEGLLFGVPTLFQRLASGGEARRAFAGAKTAGPADEAALLATLNGLVALGEQLFVVETFDGNGRTCASCHPPHNNFTIDPAFIAELPPDDPLFVAEFVPALAQNFENPVLMRQFGLIVENVDGLDDLPNKFTMRGVPHTFSQALSIRPSVIDGTGGGAIPPFERTGWSGDGAPGGGTLREFAIGAVTQHFPLTLSRAAGVDFRLPTDLELDAMEAFQLSLGRQTEFDLAAMTFSDARAAAGVVVFNGSGKCAGCHANAGANVLAGPNPGLDNANFDTGVENLPHPADATGELRPRDGGFGKVPNPDGGFGDGSFNTSSVVEAADTPPFFHNNVSETIEDAVEFYNSDEFNQSPSGVFIGGIAMTADEVDQVSAFLRVINSIDNLDRVVEELERARATRTVGDPRAFCVDDVEDTVIVLVEGYLHPGALLPLLFVELTCASVAADLAAGIDDLTIDLRIHFAINLVRSVQQDMATQ